MTVGELVEKVERDIWEAFRGQPRDGLGDMRDDGFGFREADEGFCILDGAYDLRQAARSAILAVLEGIREPSDEVMRVAAPDALHLLGRGEEWDEQFRAAFIVDRAVKRQHYKDVIDALRASVEKEDV